MTHDCDDRTCGAIDCGRCRPEVDRPGELLGLLNAVEAAQAWADDLGLGTVSGLLIDAIAHVRAERERR